ncbi:uncharacterized protein FIBRA_07249 [Fibroporia radiculosa]|uniref:ABM domain-containing protein n=1 Tax=Fibroporia radiculosa TaxID=599839 RepID=J4I0D6_9APHY|nr:uncharacterized protein FIBRA_07249 [Fibroporia radiculosa]CCM05047.1 predicted protein [Fibroporia radiculosa]
MSLPCVEVADAPATEAFLANPKDVSLVQPALDILKKSPGIIKVYYGLQTEERKHGYVFNGEYIWEKLQDHRNLQAEPEIYPELGKQCSRFFTQRSEMVHINPTADPFKAIGSPATEVASISLKAGQSKEVLEQQVGLLAATVNGLPEHWGAISAVWGPTVERDDTFGLIIGWTSVDAHWNTVKTVPELIQLLKEIREIADISLIHAELTEY